MLRFIRKILKLSLDYILTYKTMGAIQMIAPDCQRRRRNHRLIKNLLLLVTCFLVSLLSFVVIFTYSLLTWENLYFVGRLVHCLTTLASFLNPVIYILREKTFCRTLIVMFWSNQVDIVMDDGIIP